MFQLYRGGQFYWWRKTGVPSENNRPAASHWQTLSHNAVSSTPRHELLRIYIFQCLIYLINHVSVEALSTCSGGTCCFILAFPSLINLLCNWNIVGSGVKHHNTLTPYLFVTYRVLISPRVSKYQQKKRYCQHAPYRDLVSSLCVYGF